MYIHPRTTSEIQPSFTTQQPQPQPHQNPHQAHYKLQEVSGKSEVRPIVTLQRSKTTAASLHYRSTAIQGLHHQRGTFTGNNRGLDLANKAPTSGGMHFYNTLGRARKPCPSRGFANSEELCEFQVNLKFKYMWTHLSFHVII